MQVFLEGHGRLRRYPPLRVFLLLDFHIRLHDEDAAHELQSSILLSRHLFLPNVIIDPLENWPETELSSCDGTYHKLVRCKGSHFKVISIR